MKHGANLEAVIRVTGSLDEIHGLIRKHGGVLISAETMSKTNPVTPPKVTQPKKRHGGMSAASRKAQGSRLTKNWKEAKRHGFKTLTELADFKAKAAKKTAKKPTAKKRAKAAKKPTAKKPAGQATAPASA